MKYLTPAEASKKWDISLRRVQSLCSENKIPGVIRMGRQWLIPISALKPIDGRTKNAKTTFDYEAYHFPGLIWSQYYVSRSDLSDDELTLLDAQIATISYRLKDSVNTSIKLISNTNSQSVKFGAYCTMAYDNILLGDYHSMQEAIKAMEKIYDSSPSHREDYHLLLGFIKANCTFDCSDILSIDPKKLSSDAILAYQTSILIPATFSKIAESRYALLTYTSLCNYVESLGITPMAIMLHGILAHLYSCSEDKKTSLHHIREVCRIGYNEGYLCTVSKCSSLNNKDYALVFSEYGEDFSKKLNDMHQKNQGNWKKVFLISRAKESLQDLQQQELEIMLLLSNGLTTKAICNVQKMTNKVLSDHIQDLCKRFNLQTKEELIDYSRNFYKTLL